MINASDLYYNYRPIELETQTIKFSNYLASSNENIPCNTSSGSFNVTLPNLGNRVRIFDAVGNTSTTGFGANSLFVIPNSGTTIMGSDSFEIDLGGSSFDFVLVGNDWRVSGGLTPIQAPYDDLIVNKSLFDDIVAGLYKTEVWSVHLSDNVTPVGTGTNIEEIYVTKDIYMEEVWFRTPFQAPSGSGAIVRVLSNQTGSFVNIFTAVDALTIPAGSNSVGPLVPTTKLLPAGSVLRFDIQQVGATNTGLGYRVIIALREGSTI